MVKLGREADGCVRMCVVGRSVKKVRCREGKFGEGRVGYG